MAFCEPAAVVRTTRLTPSAIRVRLRAVGDWRWHTDGGGDERIDLAFPRPGERDADVAFFNDREYGHAPTDDEPPWRHYTVRAVHDDGQELDIDFVVHEGGVASGWAENAEAGDIVGVFHGGPSRSYYAPPADSQWQLLVADATGLPGLARIVEELPAGARARAIVEVPGEQDRQEIPTRGNVEWTWIIGSGGRTSALPAAVAESDVPDGPGYAWIACEAAAARRVRSHVRMAWGLSRDRHRAVGYWTAGASGHVEQDRD
ncbi:siderophore-interacting protein [Microbacterium sp. cx-55]|uniref:siderophore-interacting protein n=1 Tax=Microbacterium sp. cx-55 TaxID=2875948 RepID=UPI001CBF6DFB|nr:siderophore-interacting protein [Microbacterium sp. cx-55]MBZ4486436.1 siderophore-interacting protein [Microbacterium sp. cx-55]UGB36591.1 siderophore-interacting protein [Microbacterium sp. cx-55]